MVLRKVADEYIDAYKIQTTGPKSLKHGLKEPQGDTRDVSWFTQNIFFQNFEIGVS